MLAEAGGVGIFALLDLTWEQTENGQLAMYYRITLHKVDASLDYSAMYGVA